MNSTCPPPTTCNRVHYTNTQTLKRGTCSTEIASFISNIGFRVNSYSSLGEMVRRIFMSDVKLYRGNVSSTGRTKPEIILATFDLKLLYYDGVLGPH